MNHIRVTLEFIPVEERVPEESGEYQVLSHAGVIEYDTFDPEFIGRSWACGDDRWSHWAEIPEITQQNQHVIHKERG